MNDLVRFASSVEFATGKKRGRHPVFSARMFYPYAAERRLQIALRNELEEYIGAAYEAAVFNESFSKDSLAELSLLQEGVSDDLKAEISYAAESIARKVSSSIAEMTEMTVGKPYYPQAAKESLLKDWEANFQMLCVSAESDAKKDIARLVTQAKNEGWNGKQLEKAVKKELPEKYANRASLIARTETAKLNTSVTLETYKEIGCQYYMWMATLDERVRQDHAAMNGRICSVADPTVYFEENPEDPLHPIQHARTGEMVHMHPGEDFQCRCTMVMWDPVIDGKYEVKERPEEEEPKEPEQKPESDPKSEELEKAKERISEQEKELETTKAELKSSEKAVAELDAKKGILQKAVERHNARTQAGVEDIRERWRRRGIKIDLKKKGRSKEYIDNVFAIEKNTGIRYTGEMEHKAADSGKVNPNYASGASFKNNCQTCVIVYELRRRGFNVEALARSYGSLQDAVAIDSRIAWKDLNGKRIDFQNGRDKKFILQTKFGVNEKMADLELATQEDGRYFVSVAWKKSWGGAHVITAERKKGVLSFYDPQDNRAYSVKEFKDEIAKNTRKDCTFGIIRVDNALFDTSLNMKEIETTASI